MSEYNDHSNPEQIQRDIDRTRAEMGETLEMIRHKLSPGELLDQALSYLKDSGVGQFSRNLGATVQHHPIPVALLGVSIAWLMLVGSRESRSSHPWITTERIHSKADDGASSMADKPGQRETGAEPLEKDKPVAVTASVAVQEQVSMEGITQAGVDQPQRKTEGQSTQVIHASRQSLTT
jgi:hypothetical protein